MAIRDKALCSDDLRHAGKRRVWPHIVGLGVGAGLLIVLLISFDGAGVAAAVARLGWALVAAAVAHAVAVVGMAASWHLLLAPPGERPGFGRVLVAYGYAHALNELTPVRSAGDLLAGSMLVRRGDLSFSAMLAGVINQNALAVFSAAALSLLGVMACLAGGVGWKVLTLLAASAALLGLVSVVLFLVLRSGAAGIAVRLLTRMPGVRLAHGPAVHEKARGVDRLVEGMFRDRRRVLGACGCWIAVRLVQVVESWILLRVMLPEATNAQLLVVALAVQSAAMLVLALASFIPAQLGACEGGSAAVMILFGFAPAAGVALEIGRRLLRLAAVGCGLSAGLCLALAGRAQKRQGGVENDDDKVSFTAGLDVRAATDI